MPQTATAPRSLTPDDPRWTLARVVTLAGATIDAVAPDQLDAPTPCPDFTVRTLIRHEIAVLCRVAGLARGEDPTSIPELVADGDDADLHVRWVASAHDVQRAWTDDVLDRDVVLPFATVLGRVALPVYVCELLVHTWDLARATGLRPAWDPRIPEAAASAARIVLPASAHRRRSAFGPPVETVPGAPAIDRLAAWYGRTP